MTTPTRSTAARNRTIYGANKGANIVDRDGKEIWSMKGNIGDAYKQEHKDLIDSIRAGKPIVELRATAESSLTAVLGRMAAYTGKLVTWDFATNESKLDLFPKDFDIHGSRPEPEFAIPGKTKLVWARESGQLTVGSGQLSTQPVGLGPKQAEPLNENPILFLTNLPWLVDAVEPRSSPLP